MRRTISIVLALALPILVAPAAFASEAELSDIERPAAAVQVLPYPGAGGLAGSASVTQQRVLPEPVRQDPLRLESL